MPLLHYLCGCRAKSTGYILLLILLYSACTIRITVSDQTSSTTTPTSTSSSHSPSTVKTTATTGTTKSSNSRLGASCNNNNTDCPSTSLCLQSVCQCDSHHYTSDNVTCIPAKKYEERCSEVELCDFSLSCMPDRQCGCTSQQYYDTRNYTCQSTVSHAGICETSIMGMCEERLSCLQEEDNKNYRCLCYGENFYNYTSMECLPLSDLQPSLTSQKSTVNTIELSWTAATMNMSVTYDILLDTSDGHEDYVNETGARISGLKSGTSYHFTITSTLAHDMYYKDKNILPDINGEIWTKIDYGGRCDPNNPANVNICSEEHTECTMSLIPGGQDGYRCLCSSDYYMKQDGSSCMSLTELQVTNITVAKRDPNMVQLAWVADTHGASVTYMLQNSPDDGQVTGSVTETGGTVSGLSPGTNYSFTVTTTFPSVQYYAQKSISVTLDDVWTTIGHGGLCDPYVPANFSICQEQFTDCILYITTAETSHSRCLCTDQYYRNPSDHTCRQMNELQVKNIGVAGRSTRNITFTWTANKHGTSTTYIIKTVPSGGMAVNGPVSETGATVANLTPGTKYSFSITSSLPAALYYPVKTVVGSISGIWTMPAKPVAFQSIIPVSVMPSQYDIDFGSSQGKVTGYTFRIEGVGDINTTETYFEITLKSETTYQYSIVSHNGGGDTSEPVNGTFKTPEDPSGPVTNLTVPKTTPYSATIAWKMPSVPNGEISGYWLQVEEGSKCVGVYGLVCGNCSDITPSGDNEKCPIMTLHNHTVESLNNATVDVTIEIGNLQPYHNYTVIVAAINQLGHGLEDRTAYRTDTAGAHDVTGVKATSARNSVTNWVNLTVTWTAGNFTGPTSYLVRAEEETSIGSNSFHVVLTDVVDGYQANVHTFPNVLAFWNYRVSVMAMTDAGNSSWGQAAQIRTSTNYPGYVKKLTLTEDTVQAEKMTVQFECPPEKDRNGTVTGYVIRKTFKDSSGQTQYKDFPVAPTSTTTCSNTYTASHVGGITVEENYSFAVKTKNQDFTGALSNETNIYIEPRAVLLSQSLAMFNVSSFVRAAESADPKAPPQKTSFDVVLCASCLLDARQGSVVSVALVVCVQGSDTQCDSKERRKRSTVQFEDFASWGKAKAVNFGQEYRATPDGWKQALNADLTNYPYTLGADKNCEKLPDTSYCNGPLPSGRHFKVAAIKCNKVGCEMSEYMGVFETAGEPKPSSGDSTGLIAGLAVAGVAIVAIVIALSICVYKRRSARRGNVPKFSYDVPSQGKNEQTNVYLTPQGGAGHSYPSAEDQYETPVPMQQIHQPRHIQVSSLAKESDSEDESLYEDIDTSKVKDREATQEPEELEYSNEDMDIEENNEEEKEENERTDMDLGELVDQTYANMPLKNKEF